MARHPTPPTAGAAETAARHALEGLGIAEIALRSPATRAHLAADPERREQLRDLMRRLLAHSDQVLGEEF